jgi:hypothetical protein
MILLAEVASAIVPAGLSNATLETQNGKALRRDYLARTAHNTV